MADQAALTISIGKLAEMVEGEILNSSDRAEELISNLMVGAFCVDPSPDYFATRSDKAVITRGDRADIQLGALQTPTKCLIVTGGVRPGAAVMGLAEGKGVPVISVGKSTPDILMVLERALGQVVEEISAAEADAEAAFDDDPQESAGGN